MTDFCVVCGEVEANDDSGKYIEFLNSETGYSISRFVCLECLGKTVGN